MKTQVLKAGLLVSLKTTVKGGVSYARVEIEPDHRTDDGGRAARWETARKVQDAEEFDRAATARSKARSLVSGVCCASTFGLLCPMDRESELEAAIVQAREAASAFNASATTCNLQVYVLVGRIAQDDAEAARAIGAEMRELLADMQAGIKASDVQAIREAANKARALGGMLSADVAGRVTDAIAQARAAARDIVRRVETHGTATADFVESINLAKIEAARFAFLDLEETTGEPEEQAAQPARALDLDGGDAPIALAAAADVQPALEF